MSLKILPCVGWPHHELTADYKARAPIWREVTEEFFYEMLGAVPPLMQTRAQFMLGEPYTHVYSDKREIAVHCGLVQHNKRYFARYLPTVIFISESNNLRNHLNSQSI